MEKDSAPQPNSLVVYKQRPARVVKTSERIIIELTDGNQAKVRPKDIILLHPGPIVNLADLEPQSGELQLAWELLSEDQQNSHNLAELAEMIYGEYTPASAWATWEHLQDGLYFQGEPDAITARTPEQVQSEERSRLEKKAQMQAWQDFLGRARGGHIDPKTDAAFLREVEDLALGRRKDSRVLSELGRGERPENAHALLLACNYWDYTVVPYPVRLRMPDSAPEAPLPDLADEERADLTHLAAYAIDDRDNQDPDDAISLEECKIDEDGRLLGGRLWVHVADAAALITHDSPADLAARARGATLYLPDGQVPMLPPNAVKLLGLGLQETSPALSFGLTLDETGQIKEIAVQTSWVRVQRLSYEEAEKHLDSDGTLQNLYQLTQIYQDRRRANQALFLDMPEVILRVIDGQPVIRPLVRYRSRDLVRDAMLMAGEAAARFAIENKTPFPFATQEGLIAEASQAVQNQEPNASLAANFALRRLLRRSRVSSQPSPHAGVGLDAYSRATSPLRRYLDLVVHQQLRRHIHGRALLTEQQIVELIGQSESIVGSVNQAESLARRHWTLVYLLQNPDWQGEGVLVEKNERDCRLIIPELALEFNLRLRQDMPLDSRIPLKVQGVNLPELEAYFAALL